MHDHRPKRVHTEPIVLDIGEGFGALIVYAGPELAGHEIELSRSDQAGRVHTEIHERVANGKTVFVGVFPDLPEGTYRLLTESPLQPQVEIRSGLITEVNWP